MASYLVNEEVAELNSLGVTTAEAEARLGGRLVLDGADVYALGRQGEAMVHSLLHEARQRHTDRLRRQALAAGHLVEWRRISGTWVLAGRHLREGDIVTVTRRDGTTTTEVVGPLIGCHDGLTLARTGRL